MVEESGAPKKLPQYIGAIIVTLGGLCLGTVLSWSSPAQDLVINQLKKSALELNWIFSIVTLGCAVASIATGFLVDLIGRKYCLIFMAALLTGGWFIIMFANGIVVYCVGRFLTGFASGSFSVSCPTYLSELAHKSIRGQLGVMFQIMIVIGILMGYSLGETHSLWVLNVLFAALPILLIVCMIPMAESPVYLFYRGRLDEAKRALIFYRGKDYAMEEELAEIDGYTKKTEDNFWQTFRQKATLKGFSTLMLLHIFQQLSGINVIIFYAHNVFAKVMPKFPAGIASIMLSVVQLTSTGVSAYIVDKFGRRILWLVSMAVMTVSLIIVGVHFFLMSSKSPAADTTGPVAIFFINVYLVGFSLGAGPLAWLMLGELLPNSMKLLCAVVACTNWLMAFVVTIVFDPLVQVIGEAAIFWTFSVICLIGFVYVLFFLIETKDKALEEIQREFAGKT